MTIPKIRTSILAGEVAKLIKRLTVVEIIYKERPQFAPRSMKMQEIIEITSPIFHIANCAGIGIELLTIDSSTTGLFIDVKLVRSERSPPTIKNQEINVTNLGRLFTIIYAP